MKKYDIFNHLIDSLLFIGNEGGYRVSDGIDKTMITTFASPVFNYIIPGSLDNKLIDEFIEENIPFICLPQSNIEKKFQMFCEQKKLVKAGEVIAHEFTELDIWNYQKDPKFSIKKVINEEELYLFDNISSIAFEHPNQMAMKFLQPALGKQDISLFLAYYESKPVGCGMISFVNNVAGLYWGGVLPKYRKLGIGTELTKYRMNYTKEHGFQNVVAQNMIPSIGYYQKIGFKPEGSLPLYLYAGKNQE